MARMAMVKRAANSARISLELMDEETYLAFVQTGEEHHLVSYDDAQNVIKEYAQLTSLQLGAVRCEIVGSKLALILEDNGEHVLAYRPEDRWTPWVTWRKFERTDDNGNNWNNYEWGHYYETERAARADWSRRIMD